MRLIDKLIAGMDAMDEINAKADRYGTLTLDRGNIVITIDAPSTSRRARMMVGLDTLDMAVDATPLVGLIERADMTL